MMGFGATHELGTRQRQWGFWIQGQWTGGRGVCLLRRALATAGPKGGVESGFFFSGAAASQDDAVPAGAFQRLGEGPGRLFFSFFFS